MNIYKINSHTKKKMNIRKNNGITLVALVITIILLLVVSGISITGKLRGDKESKSAEQISELNIIQHALLERYTRAQLTKEELPGTTITKADVQDIIDDINGKTGNNIELKGTEYKKLEKADLENLGITREEDTFIVNYKTGEVINETVRVTNLNKALYVYSQSSEDSNQVQAIVSNGLILYYDAINNTGSGHSDTTNTWKDLSGYGNDGKLYNFKNSTESGWNSKYLTFNGTDNSVIAKNVIKNLENMTIEFVYTSKIKKSWQYYWGIKGNYFGLEANSEDSRVIYYDKTDYAKMQTFNSIKDDIGKKVSNTIVFNKNNIQAYKNGEQIGTALIHSMGTEGEYFGIGSDGQKNYCTKMDCYTFRIYNRSLNADEVKSNYEFDKIRFEI